MRSHFVWLTLVGLIVACADRDPRPDVYPVPSDGGRPEASATTPPPPPPPPPAPPKADPTCIPDVDGGAEAGTMPTAAADDGFCKPGPGDADGDGYTVADGDCNDNDCAINPGAFDIPGDGIDQDCSGTPDDEPTGCDDGLAIEGNDALDGAKAMGLCRSTTAAATGKQKTWGVISAKWTLPDGNAEKVSLSRGILPSFGVNTPRAGKSLLAISSGAARAADQPGFEASGQTDKAYACTAPQGYPKVAPACPGIKNGECRDGAALVLEIRVPTNARSLSVKQNLFTYEYPDYICSSFNDYYVTMMDPKPSFLPDGNIAFDPQGNPISVNTTLLQVCEAQMAGGKQFACPLGNSTLQGTGLEGHAATGWLTTRAPLVRGSTIKLTFAIWDSGDGNNDSTVLVDDFTWSTDPLICPKTTAADTK